MDLIICEPNLDSPGGRQRVILEIAKKYNPIIYTYAYNKAGTMPDFKEFDIRVPKELKLNSRFTIRTGQAFWNMKLNNYDVINAHWGPSHWIRHYNPRVLWYCHSPSRSVYDLREFRHENYPFYLKPFHNVFTQWYKKRDSLVVPQIEKVLANSHNTQERLKRFLSKESSIIYPGINPKDYECKRSEKFFLLLTRICPTKRLEYAIDAFHQFSLTHPHWKLKIVGSLHPKDIAYYHTIKRMHNDITLDVSDTEKFDYLSRCSALLFSSVNEDFGIIPLEGMASSKPVIAVNEGGPKESVINGKTGYLVNSPQSMAQKMREIADHPDIAEKLGRVGRRHVIQNFTWKQFLQKFNLALKEVAKS